MADTETLTDEQIFVEIFASRPGSITSVDADGGESVDGKRTRITATPRQSILRKGLRVLSDFAGQFGLDAFATAVESQIDEITRVIGSPDGIDPALAGGQALATLRDNVVIGSLIEEISGEQNGSAVFDSSLKRFFLELGFNQTVLDFGIATVNELDATVVDPVQNSEGAIKFAQLFQAHYDASVMLIAVKILPLMRDLNITFEEAITLTFLDFEGLSYEEILVKASENDYYDKETGTYTIRQPPPDFEYFDPDDAGGGYLDNCFLAEVPVLMADGTRKPICDVRVGDAVLSFDPSRDQGKGALEPKSVVRLFRSRVKEILRLGDVGVTPGHRFLCGDGSFKCLGSLNGVDYLVHGDGRRAEPVEATLERGEFDVYNFEVEDNHTYVAADFRVHNESLIFAGRIGTSQAFLYNGAETGIKTIIFMDDQNRIRVLEVGSDGATITEKVFSQDFALRRVFELSSGAPDITGLSDQEIVDLYRSGSLLDQATVASVLLEAFQRDKALTQRIEFAGEIGSIFGSTIGNALAGENPFLRIGASAAIGTLAENLFETIGNGFDPVVRPILEESYTVLDDVALELGDALKGAAVGALSSFLTAELGEALGIDGGFEGQLFNSVSSRTIGTVLNTVADNALDPNVTNLFQGLDPSSVLTAGAGAIGGFVGGYLARELYTAETAAGAIGGTLGGAIGGFIGGGIAAGFVGVGTSAAASSLLGGVGASLATSLGITTALTGVSTLVASFILPGVGAFLGVVLGSLIGDLIGSSPDPEADQEQLLYFANGRYVEGDTDDRDGGNRELAKAMGERTRLIINNYLDLIGGMNVNSLSPTIVVGHDQNDIFAKVRNPEGGSTYFERPTADEAIDAAVAHALKRIQVQGGNLHIKRAVQNSSAESLTELAGDMKVAEDFARYLEDKDAIDALIASDPTSAFAAGWLITLVRAEELRLNEFQASDFYGGMAGFLHSLRIEDLDLTPDSVDIALDSGNLVVSYQSEISPGVFETVVLARVEDYETVIGFAEITEETSVDGTTHVFTGTDSRDIWFAPNGQSNRFNDVGNYRDELSDDVLFGGDGADEINAGMGWDFVRAGAGNDTVDGGPGNDLIHGEAGNDLLKGDTANFNTAGAVVINQDENDGSTREWFGVPPNSAPDRLGISDGSVVIRTPEGADEIHGGEGNDTIDGLGGSDRLFGGAGADSIMGGSGDDLIAGGDGADVIDGGIGFDAVDYSALTSGITVNLADGTAADGDTITNVEDVIGTDSADTLTGDAGDNMFDARLGDDTIDGGGGTDTVVYHFSEQAVTVDLQAGTATREIPDGVDGNGDPVFLTETDTLSNIESAIGSGFDDHFIGSPSGGILAGGAGDDTLEIGNDDAAVAGGAGATGVHGGDGFDTLTFENHTSGIVADVAEHDTGNSYSGIEQVIGSDFNDNITTHDGTQIVDGGEGADTLAGGTGDDVYVFNRGDGSDVITDISQEVESLNPGSKRVGSRHIEDEHRILGGGTDGISLGEGLQFRHVFGSLTGGTTALALAAAAGETGPDVTEVDAGAADLEHAHLTLAFKTDTQLYESSLEQFSDKITIEYGGIVPGGDFEVTHLEIHRWTTLSPKTDDVRHHSNAINVGIRFSFDEGAGDIERLGFEDSGYIEIGTVAHFLNGTVGADTGAGAIQANNGEATWLFAGDGADEVNGADADDILVGDLGDDTLAGGAGGDQYAYWAGDGHDIIDDSAGKDALVFGGGISRDDVTVRYGRLTIGGDASSFEELAKDDVNATALRFDVLELDPADPDNRAVTGSVTILNYDALANMVEEFRFAGGEVVTISDVLGEFTATNHADVLTGTSEAETIAGGEGGDVLRGGGGDDVLKGGASGDTLDGGLGKDLVSYEDSASAVTVDLSLGEDPQASSPEGGDEDGDVILNTEGVIGSAFDDTLTGNEFGNELIGGAGADTLSGGGGDDILDGGAGADVLDGGDGSDTVRYAGSSAGVTVDIAAATASGGDAAGDTLTSIENATGSEFADTLTGDDNENVLTGLGGADTLEGKLGDDTLSGDAGADTLRGDGGKDTIGGGAGNDSIYGGADDDVLEGGEGADLIDGGGGIDTATYAGSDAAVTVSLTSGPATGGHAQGDTFLEVENLTGSGFDDTLTGDAGGNVLAGGSGNDTLEGMAGADTIDGGAGDDTAKFSGNRSAFDVVRDGDKIIVTRIADTADADELSNVETLSFSDGDILIADIPDAAEGSVQTPQGKEASGQLSGIDGQSDAASLSYVLEQPATNGTVVVSSDGSYTYTPAAGFTGSDTFRFRVTDTDGYSDVAEVQVTVYEDVWAAGTETKANTHSPGTQLYSAVAALSDGGYVVTWASSGQDGSGYGVFGQRYDSAGTAVGSEFQINTHTLNDQQFPDVAGFDGGGFVVVWESSNGQDGSAKGIYAQRYDASGVAVGSEFLVNTHTSNDQRRPAVATFDDGDFVVVWESNSQDGSNFGIFGQRFNASGVAVGSEFQVNSYTTSNQLNAAVATFDDGGFVVVWDSNGQDGSNAGVYGQRYDASGAAVGSEFQISTYTTNHQREPLVAALVGGGFVVAWESNGQDGSNYGVYAQRYNADGTAAGSEFLVNTDTLHSEDDTSVGALADGGFVISWGASDGQDGSGYGIFAQRYAADGSAVGSEFQINSYTTGNQRYASVAGLTGGGIAATWGSNGQDAGTWGVYSRIYSPTSQDLVGTAGNDALVGSEADDRLEGLAGADNLDGGRGTDTADYSASKERVQVNLDSGSGEGGDAQGDQLTDIENITGSDHDDSLVGNAGGNVLAGGAGDDDLEGGAGADILDGGDGLDTAIYSDSTSAVTVDLTAGTAIGGDAAGDVLSNIENLVGSAHDDVLTGDAGRNNLSGGAGIDELHGSGGDDVLNGGDGADSVWGGAGDDYEEGGLGNDTLHGEDGNDELHGGEGDDTLVGHNDNDTLFGDAGSDTLRGSSGNDTLEGGAGSDAIYGDDGIDTASYTGSALAVTVNLGSGAASGGDAAGDALDGIENLTGSSHDDHLTGDAGVNTLTGGAGIDELFGAGGDDVLIGGEGADSLWGGSENDTLEGGLGNDTLRGETGDDSIDGGDGNDTIAAHQGNDTLVGGAGNDSLYGNEGNDTLLGGTGNDNMQAHAGDDTLRGEDGDDYLDGADGNDTVEGGAGTDTLKGGLNDDTLEGGAGADTIDGGAGTDLATYFSSSQGVTVSLVAVTQSDGDAAGDTLTGIENLRGSQHADTLTGDANANSLDAEAGDDELEGGAGADTIDGGEGSDTVSYATSASAVTVDLDSGLTSGGDALGDQLIAVENLKGSLHADTLTGDSTDNSIQGLDGADTITGGSGNDQLLGNDGDDDIQGGNGSDTVWGGLGNDTIGGGLNDDVLYGEDGGDRMWGGDGADTLDGGIGWDWMWGGDGNDVLIGDWGNDILYGQDGNDVLSGGAGSDTVDGGVGADTAIYTASASAVIVNLDLGTGTGGDAQGDTLVSIENLRGSQHDDTLIGDAGANLLQGEEGDDTVQGGEGADTIEGGAGTDTASYITSASGVTVNLSTGGTAGGDAQGDQLTGIENLRGSQHDDTLIGDAGANLLQGEEGDDTVQGGAGADTIEGGAGIDTASYLTSASGVTVNLSTGGAVGGDAQGDQLTGIENLEGSNQGDVLTGDGGQNALKGSAGNDHLYGLGGADVLNGGDGIDTARYDGSGSAVTVNLQTGLGSGGDAEGDQLIDVEYIHGSAFGDVLTGNDVLNIFYGNGGDDSLSGGAGNDQLYGDAGADTVDGGDGTDLARYDRSESGVTVDLKNNQASGGHAAGDELHNIENLHGSQHADTLIGDDLNNYLYGFGGNDTIHGGLGHDSLFGDAGADSIDGGEGLDLLRYDRSDAGVIVNLQTGAASGGHADGDEFSNIERLHGSLHADDLTGDGLANYLFGFDGNDTLSGGAGSDNLFGDAGADTIDGGDGSDMARYDRSDAGVTVNLKTGLTSGGHAQGDELTAIEHLAGSQHADTLTGDDFANDLYGKQDNDALYGGQGNDRIFGEDGDDVLVGEAGSDVLNGGLGSDSYQFGIGGDQDTIINSDNDAQSTDSLDFVGAIVKGDIWFQHIGNDLVVSVLGTQDQVTVQDWYLGSSNELDEFTTIDGSTLDAAQVESLVSAMATFQPNDGTDSTGVLPGALPQDVQIAVNAAWQSGGA